VGAVPESVLCSVTDSVFCSVTDSLLCPVPDSVLCSVPAGFWVLFGWFCPFLLTLLCSLCVLGTGLVDTVVADAVGGDGFEESEI